MHRYVLMLVIPALFAACISLPGVGLNIGIVEDETLRTFLRTLALVDDQDCAITGAGGRRMTMRCRVFRGPSDERIVGAYDLVTDRPIVVLLLHDDGRQEVLWRPARRARTRGPEVVL